MDYFTYLIAVLLLMAAVFWAGSVRLMSRQWAWTLSGVFAAQSLMIGWDLTTYGWLQNGVEWGPIVSRSLAAGTASLLLLNGRWRWLCIGIAVVTALPSLVTDSYLAVVLPAFVVTGSFLLAAKRQPFSKHWCWLAVGAAVGVAWYGRAVPVYQQHAILQSIDDNLLEVAWLGLCSLGAFFGSWLCFRTQLVKGADAPRRKAYFLRELVMLGILFAVLTAGWSICDRVSRGADAEWRDDLKEETKLIAAALPQESIARLLSGPIDSDAASYQRVKAKLAEVKAQGDEYRFVYLITLMEGEPVFLADSEPAGSEDESSWGDVYAEASLGLIEALREKGSLVEGPLLDEWGVWISGLAPIPGDQLDRTVLVGVDKPASAWNLKLARIRDAAMFFATLMVGLVCFSFALNARSFRSDAALLASTRDLQQSREEARRLALVAERTSNAVIIADRNGLIEWGNTGFEKITGYQVEEVIGRSPGSFLQCEASDPAVDERMREAIRNYQPFSETLLNQAKDGKRYWVEIECQPLLDNKGACTGFMAIEQEITARVEAERVVAEQRNRLKILNDSLASLGDDYQQNIQALTQLACEICGAWEGFYLRPNHPRILVENAQSEDQPAKVDGGEFSYICYDIIQEGELFYYVENTLGVAYSDDDPPLPLLQISAYVDQDADVTGRTIGSLGVLFNETRQGFTSELRESLLIIAQAFGREELLQQSRSQLDRTVAEANTQRSRLSTLLENIDDAVMVEDEVRQTSFANTAFLRMFELDRSQVETVSGQPLIEELADAFQSSTGFVSSSRDAVEKVESSANQSFRTTDGRYLSREFYPIRDSENLRGYLWRFRDITRQYRYERNLEALAHTGNLLLRNPLDNEEGWHALVEVLGGSTGSSGVVVYQFHSASQERAATVARWVHPAAQIDPLLEALSDSPGWLMPTSGDTIVAYEADNPRIRDLLQTANTPAIAAAPLKAVGRSWGLMLFIARKGHPRWSTDETALLETMVGQISSRLELQAAYRDLLQAKNAADTANRAKSSFLAAMSHEIRTPLNAVIGMASMLEKSDLSPEQQECSSTITNSANMLLHLVSDVLDYSKIEADRLELENTAFDLHETVVQNVDMLRPEAKSRGNLLNYHISPDIPRFYRGDRARLGQIIMNLLSNAVKFTKEGEVELKVELDRDRLTFKVRDTGIGLSDEAMKRLFDPFIQADSSTTRKFGGSGLGLAISQRLANLMNGAISVTSQEGKGSVFTVELPLRLVEPNEVTDAGPEKPSSSSMTSNKDLCILIVEDNLTNQRVIKMMLKRLGYRSDLAINGIEACEQVEKKDYDLIFMDVQMDAMDGLTATRKIREFESSAQRLPAMIIALTANAFAEDREACKAAGMNDFLPKPITLDCLKEVIEAAATTASVSPADPTMG